MRLRQSGMPVAAALAMFAASDLAAQTVKLAAPKTAAPGQPVVPGVRTWPWSRASGPNGPIPAIVVDQFGYAAASRKIAVLRDPQIGYDDAARYTPSQRIALVDLATEAIVATGPATTWNGGATDGASGDRAWWFDFSQVVRPGRYVVADLEASIRSAEFGIGPGVYRPVMERATRMFFYQRAGMAKLRDHAGDAWADGASHLGPGQDSQSKPWPGTIVNDPATTVRDLRGGWYDAGDYNKYTNWTARNIIVLLDAYEEHPTAFRDDTNIPESGNGVADLLDEVKWALDWLMRMQGPDGAVLCVQALASASPPSRAAGPSSYGPPTTSATLSAAAAFARAAHVYRTLGRPEMSAFADELGRRAVSAWTWAAANPSVLYWNNDEARQPGSKGLAHGQQEMNEADRKLVRFEAALSLFAITGDPGLKVLIETTAETMPQREPSLWEIDLHDALLRFSTTSGISQVKAEEIRARFMRHVGTAARNFAADVARGDPYRAPIQAYTWGSNKAKAMQARLFQLAALHTRDQEVRDAGLSAARAYVHYVHGVNPLGLVYLSNMGEAGATHSVNTMFHAWFAKGTRWDVASDLRPGPAPGYLVGGPNPAFNLDGCCRRERSVGNYSCGSRANDDRCRPAYRPPLGQPPAKSYLQFNDTWPANSWEVTEPSTVYQAYYIRMLAPFVD